jgi:MFS family permease
MVCILNYADRQLIFTVFPLLGKEFRLADSSLWILSGSFMWMYALFGPLAGAVCDRLQRRTVILGALLFWSLTVMATAWASQYWQLVAGVALGGLGEAFYFPAAISLISDYHGAGTRSRAMSLHQSGVYVGSIAGGGLAGFIGQFYGWRLGFRLFGATGCVVALVLLVLLRESPRGMSDSDALRVPTAGRWMEGLREIASNLAARLLIFVFMGANFVAMIFTVWMPTFLYRKFHMSLSMSGLNGTAYLQVASIMGVFLGGVLADALVKKQRGSTNPRMLVQSLGLFCGVPFLFLSGWAPSVALVMAAMVGFGLSKGVYDSNLWAALYDVVPIERRGVSVGLTNSIGWLGGALAQLSIGFASARFGLSASISATAAIYLCIGAALLWGARRLATKSLAGEHLAV